MTSSNIRYSAVMALLLLALTRVCMADCQLGKLAELPVTMAGTRPLIAGTIDGHEAHFLADSGSFFSLLVKSRATELKLRRSKLPSGFLVWGIGGATSGGVVTAKEFDLTGLHGGPIRHVDFLVLEDLALGPGDGVIGQNVLGIGDTEYDLANGMIRILHVKGCDKSRLDYWNKKAEFGLLDIDHSTPQYPHIFAQALLDGIKIRVMFDTGSATSLLSRRIADKAGVTPTTPGVIAAGYSSGVGRRRVETWIGVFKSLDLGGETVKNIKIRFGDVPSVGDQDLLLGADFFLSHRIYVAKSQNKLYFTYNGGPVFDLKIRTESANASPVAGDEVAAVEPTATAENDYTDTPKDAAAFKRRGTASAARGDLPSALHDLDRAVELDPKDPDTFYQRALVRLRAREAVLVMHDLDESLLLQADPKVLLLRAELRLASKDTNGARADLNAATEIPSSDETLNLRIASTEVNAGLFNDAIARYDHWIGAHSGDAQMPTVLNNRCWARASKGDDLKLALADCDSALHSSPRSASFLNSRGMVRLRLGDLDKAMNDYKVSLEINPKLASSLYGLGLVEQRKGLKEDADRDIQAAVKLSPAIADQYQRIGLAP